MLHVLFSDPETESLREHRMEELDYYLLPEAAWNILVLWYGITKDSRPIARYIHVTVTVVIVTCIGYIPSFTTYLYRGPIEINI